jgi:hypothetical protein
MAKSGLFEGKERCVRWQREASLRAKSGLFDGKEGSL